MMKWKLAIWVVYRTESSSQIAASYSALLTDNVDWYFTGPEISFSLLFFILLLKQLSDIVEEISFALLN